MLKVASLLHTSSRLSHSFSRELVARRFYRVTPLAAAKLTVEQLAERVDLKGQNVLVRVDLNVPLAKVGRKRVDRQWCVVFDSYSLSLGRYDGHG